MQSYTKAAPVSPVAMTRMCWAFAPLTLTVFTGAAHAETYHYACRTGEARYALTVNTDKGIVKLNEHGPSGPPTTFKIKREATVDECGKFGWILDDAILCTYTQGVASLDWHGRELECDNADAD